MKGQAFVLGAVIFTSLFLVALLPSGPSIQSGGSASIQEFYDRSYQQRINVFNQELAENRSVDHVKRKLYVYDRFIERSAGRKGASFYSYDFLVLPEDGEALFINHMDREIEVDVNDGSWTNTTVEASQFQEYDISSGENVTVRIPEFSNTHELSAEKPSMAFWMRMERQSQSVERTYTG